MSVVVPYGAIDKVASSSDPKKAITEAVGDLSGLHIQGDLVLLGTYIRPQKTAGGIIRPDVNVQEDVWQGKVGLVLKWGPNAYLDPEDGSLYEERANVGEWGVFFVGDAKSININGYPCRLVKDTNIRATVDDPKMVL